MGTSLRLKLWHQDLAKTFTSKMSVQSIGKDLDATIWEVLCVCMDVYRSIYLIVAIIVILRTLSVQLAVQIPPIM